MVEKHIRSIFLEYPEVQNSLHNKAGTLMETSTCIVFLLYF